MPARLKVSEQEAVPSCVACPRDAARLEFRRTQGLDVLQCTECGGLWLPPRTVEVAIGRRVRPIAAGSSRTSLRCPSDGTSLAQIRSGGVEVDVCTACHGLWLDRGELATILRNRQRLDRGDGAVGVNPSAPSRTGNGRSGSIGALEAGGAVLDVFDLGATAIGAVLEVLGALFSGF